MLMKVFVKATSLLLIFCLLHSCSPKLKADLGRREIIHAQLTPIFKKPVEVSDYFYLGLVIKLNNGNIKRKYFVIDENKYFNSEINYSKKNSYWEQFNIVTYNCIFNNGKIKFNRNGTQIPDFVAIKIIAKNGSTSDSFGIDIPKIDSIKIEYQTNSTISPSFVVPFNLVAYYNNNHNIIISDNNGFDAYSGNYKVKIQNAIFAYPYQYQIPADTDFIKSFTVVSHHISDTSLHDSISIPLKYDGQYRFNYQGQSGQNGGNGSDAYRRDRIGNGENGQKGQKGQNGGSGPKVNVVLKSFIVDSSLYIKVISYSNDAVNTCIINPKLGRVIINNIGGAGSSGGEGGRGAKGEDQTDKNAAGSGGSGGEGGDGGDGGKGGTFKVYADSVASLYFDKIDLINDGGFGGQGGSGGKNGAAGNEKLSGTGSYLVQSLVRSIFTGRGLKGMSGYSGEKGEEPAFEIITKKAIDQMEQRVSKR